MPAGINTSADIIILNYLKRGSMKCYKNHPCHKFSTCIIVNFSIEKCCIICLSLGSPLVDGIFLVQKMCIYSCVTLSTTLLIRAVQFNARSACDASMFTSCIYIFLRLASKCLNCTRSPEEMVQKLHKYD